MGELRGLSALEAWSRRITAGYTGVCISNLTTSWRDGLAFCAVIHHYRPDLIDFNSLSKDDILKNNQLAFQVMESLGVPSLLDAEDMVKHEEPDRLSIATYLSLLYEKFEKEKGGNCTNKSNGISSPSPANNNRLSSPRNSLTGSKHSLELSSGRREDGNNIWKQKDDDLNNHSNERGEEEEGVVVNVNITPMRRRRRRHQVNGVSNGDSGGEDDGGGDPDDDGKNGSKNNFVSSSNTPGDCNNGSDAGSNSLATVMTNSMPLSSSATEKEAAMITTTEKPTASPRRKARCVSCQKNVLSSEKVVVDGITYHQSCWEEIESGGDVDSLVRSRRNRKKAEEEDQKQEEGHQSEVQLKHTGNIDVDNIQHSERRQCDDEDNNSNNSESIPADAISVVSSCQSSSLNLETTVKTTRPNFSNDRDSVPLSSCSGETEKDKNTEDKRKSNWHHLTPDSNKIRREERQEHVLLRQEKRNHSSPIDDDDSTEKKNTTSPCQDSCSLSLRDTDYAGEYGDCDNDDDDKGDDYDVKRNEERRSKEVNCESTRTTEVTVEPSHSERIVLTSCNRTSTTHSVSTNRNLDESSRSPTAAFRVRKEEAKGKKEPNSQAALSTISKTTKNSRNGQEQKVPNTKTQHIYPVTLNPFGDDEEEEEENQNDMVSHGKITKSGRSRGGRTSANKQQRNPVYPSDLNPFGDEDDEHEKSDERQSGIYHDAGGHQGSSSITNGRTSKHTCTTRGRRRSKYDESLNPFASEDDEEEEQGDSQSLTSTASTPIPKPRSSLANASIRSGKSTISAPDVISGQTSGNVPFRKSTSSFMTTSLNRKSLHLRPSVPPPPAPTVLDSQGRPLTPSIKKKKAPSPPTQQHPVSSPSSSVISGERDSNSLLSVSTTIATSTPSIPGTPESSRSSIARKMSLTPSEATTCGGGDSDSIRTGDNASHDDVPLAKSRTSGPSRKKRPAPEPPKAVRRTVVGSIEEIESDLSSLGDRLSEIQSRLVKVEESLTSKNANNLSSSSTGANEEEQFDQLIYEYLSLAKETCVIARRQEELMYQRREHKLEQEHADLEFGIRALQLIPPFKKTPEEEAKEVELIQRLVDVVDQRNDVVENMTKINKRPDFEKMIAKLRKMLNSSRAGEGHDQNETSRIDVILSQFYRENDLEMVVSQVMALSLQEGESKETTKKSKKEKNKKSKEKKIKSNKSQQKDDSKSKKDSTKASNKEEKNQTRKSDQATDQTTGDDVKTSSKGHTKGALKTLKKLGTSTLTRSGVLASALKSHQQQEGQQVKTSSTLPPGSS